jgi:hypothetical protein
MPCFTNLLQQCSSNILMYSQFYVIFIPTQVVVHMYPSDDIMPILSLVVDML